MHERIPDNREPPTTGGCDEGTYPRPRMGPRDCRVYACRSRQPLRPSIRNALRMVGVHERTAREDELGGRYYPLGQARRLGRSEVFTGWGDGQVQDVQDLHQEERNPDASHPSRSPGQGQYGEGSVLLESDQRGRTLPRGTIPKSDSGSMGLFETTQEEPYSSPSSFTRRSRTHWEVLSALACGVYGFIWMGLSPHA